MYPFSILYLIQSLERKKLAVVVARGVCFQVIQGKATVAFVLGKAEIEWKQFIMLLLQHTGVFLS